MFVRGIGERGVNWRWSPRRWADASPEPLATACSATGPLVSDRALYGYGHGAVWYGVSGWSMDSQASRALSSLDISHLDLPSLAGHMPYPKSKSIAKYL